MVGSFVLWRKHFSSILQQKYRMPFLCLWEDLGTPALPPTTSIRLLPAMDGIPIQYSNDADENDSGFELINNKLPTSPSPMKRLFATYRKWHLVVFGCLRYSLIVAVSSSHTNQFDDRIQSKKNWEAPLLAEGINLPSPGNGSGFLLPTSYQRRTRPRLITRPRPGSRLITRQITRTAPITRQLVGWLIGWRLETKKQHVFRKQHLQQRYAKFVFFRPTPRQVG